jgi:hypothetical protein
MRDRAMPDEPPEDLGTVGLLVFAVVLVGLIIIGIVLLIASRKAGRAAAPPFLFHHTPRMLSS